MFMLKKITIQTGLFIIVLAVIVGIGATLSSTEPKETVEDGVIRVNETEMSEKEFSMIMNYMKERMQGEAMMRGEEAPGLELVREKAIEEAIEYLLLQEYIRESGVIAEEEEIEKFYNEIIGSDPSLETKEEFFTQLEKEGLDKEEVHERIILQLSVERILDMYAKEANITTEDVEKYYEELQEMGADIPPFQEISEMLADDLIMTKAQEKLSLALEKEKEGADIEIYLEDIPIEDSKK